MAHRKACIKRHGCALKYELKATVADRISGPKTLASQWKSLRNFSTTAQRRRSSESSSSRRWAMLGEEPQEEQKTTPPRSLQDSLQADALFQAPPL